MSESASGPGDDAGDLDFLQPSPRPDSLGRLGHYEALQVLGRGEFGIVFRAFDVQLQRVVAIKVLAPQLAATSLARKRFLREARSSAMVRHENVVNVYAVEEQPLPYLVMELVPGETLHQRLDRIGPLEPAEVVRIGRQITEGLAAAHATGLIHRDIKPANILIEAGPDQRVKITDFGLARAADDASLTQSGVISGTPMYMSPEQAQSEALDHRADLFSLGSVLYTLCTGQPPFRANKTLGVLKRVCDDTPRPIRDCNADIPEALAAIVNRLLEKDPAGRFQTAAEVADLLKQHLADLDDRSLPSPSRVVAGAETTVDWPAVSARSPEAPSPKTRTRHRWPRSAAATLVLLPVLTLTLTEAVGVTHWFPGAGALTDPDNPESEPPSQGANHAQAEKQLPPDTRS
jgi:serine/threonine protein kinase